MRSALTAKSAAATERNVNGTAPSAESGGYANHGYGLSPAAISSAACR